ncbi:MAG: hypothetical protein FJW39_15280 [Acidobacteria bacterium]|nr:hypothetical protein [Acidobacteriota bacterium]
MKPRQFARRIAAVAVLCCGASAQTGPSIFYTGRTLGYLRHPDRQTDKDDACKQPDGNALPQVKAFLEELNRWPAGDRLLLGLGDNLAGEGNSRMLYLNGKPKPKDELEPVHENGAWVWKTKLTDAQQKKLLSGRSTLPADNVACFLIHAGYAALVPGKHDFHFGPERLRQIARLLARHGTHMLATNLSISTTQSNAPPPRPDYLKKLPFRTSSTGVSVDLPDVVLPWLKRVRLRGAFRFQRALDEFSSAAAVERADPAERPAKITIKDESATTYDVEWRMQRVELCEADRPGNPDSISPGPGCTPLNPAYAALGRGRPTNDVDLDFPPGFEWKAGQNYGLCIYEAGANQPYCARFSVHTPFFQYPLGFGDAPDPYVLRESNGHKFAIFGVVDTDLRDHVGLLNDTWLYRTSASDNKNRREDVSVVVADPVRALQQLLQHCDANPDCRDRRRILLAHMPHDRASLLPLRLGQRFDLILAQTDDRHATGNESITRTLSGAARPGFVAVPRQVYSASKPDAINLALQRLRLIEDPAQPSQWTMANEVYSREKELPSLGSNGSDSLRKSLESAAKVNRWLRTSVDPGPASWSSTDLFFRVALAEMREHHHTDIALLQRRDIFEPAFHARVPSAPEDVQKVVDRALWKGDFVVRIEATGATIRAVMDRSAQFDRLDRDALHSDTEPGRGLVTLGLVRHPDSRLWHVNGEPLEDSRLYTIAATDYVALGDTGYPEFRKPPVGPPLRLKDFAHITPLNPLVCRALVDDDRHCRESELAQPDYFPTSNLRPFDTRPGFTTFRRWRAWPSQGFVRPKAMATANAAESGTHNRPVYSLALERIDFSYSLYRHGQATERELPQRFSGVGISQLAAPWSRALGSSARLRGRRAGKTWDQFLVAEQAYSSQLTRQADGTDLLDQKSNLFATEGGVNLRIWPWRNKSVPDVKALGSVRWQTQWARPGTAFSLGSRGVIRGFNDRTTTVLGKVGVRVQNVNSWLETGYQNGVILDSPVAYEFFKEGLAAVTCNPEAQRSLATCLAATRVERDWGFRPIHDTRRQQGLFLNFRMQMPLPVGDGRLFYVMENRGDLFLNRHGHDISLDTRYLDVWTHTLLIPIWGGMNLAPKIEYWFFKNKVDFNFFRSRQSSIGVQYRFDWRYGMRWKTALRK